MRLLRDSVEIASRPRLPAESVHLRLPNLGLALSRTRRDPSREAGKGEEKRRARKEGKGGREVKREREN
eukprot:5364236-Pleurochrysis_carterae.AAC.1